MSTRAHFSTGDAPGMPPAVYAPLRSLADIEAVEAVPFLERFKRFDFAQNLLDGCRRQPDKIAIHAARSGDPDGPLVSWRYAELVERACQVANLLRQQGLASEDAVAVVTPNVPGLFAAMLGGFLAVRPFPINWMLDASALLELMRSACVKAVIALGPTPGFQIWENVDAAVNALPERVPVYTLHDPHGPAHDQDLLTAAAACAPRLSFVRAATERGTVAAYVHSGGTTGHPKIVQLTHGGLVYRQWATNLGLALTSDDVTLIDTPMFHIGGLCVRGLVPIADGMTVVIPSLLGARDKTYIANYWRFVERFGITQISGVPTTLSVLAKNPPAGQDISSLKPYFSTGSTPMAPATRQRIFEVTGARPLMMYGLTENTSNVTIEPRDGMGIPGSSGLRVPYTMFRVVETGETDEILRDCNPGEPGLLLVSGPGISPGYLDGRQNAGIFRNDGWMNTGDLGSVDLDGNIHISGRSKDIIIRGGHNIEPLIIEEALARHPAVALAAAVGKPDAHAGELPIVFVQLQEHATATAEDLLHFAAAHIPERPAIPKEVVFLDKLPLSAVGKPLKHVLRRKAADQAFREILKMLPTPWDIQVEERDARGLHLTLRLPDDAAIRAQATQLLSQFSIQFSFDTQTAGEARLRAKIDASRVLAHPALTVAYQFDARETMLHALATGLGIDLMNEDQLAFAYDDFKLPLRVLPTLPMVLGWTDLVRDKRSWDPSLGIDPHKVVVGQAALTLHQPLAAQGRGTTRSFFADLVDKGPGRGAMVLARREVVDDQSRNVATIDTWLFVRGAGGFGGKAEGGPPVVRLPQRVPDGAVTQPTSGQTALLYRLMLRDHNAVHGDPAYAARVGFEKPILHGLATLSIAIHSAIAAATGSLAEHAHRLAYAQAKLVSPVFPGDLLTTEIWRENNAILFRTRVLSRDTTVIDAGKVLLRI